MAKKTKKRLYANSKAINTAVTSTPSDVVPPQPNLEKIKLDLKKHKASRCFVGEIIGQIFCPLGGKQQEYEDIVQYKHVHNDKERQKEADISRRIPQHPSLLRYFGLTTIGNTEMLTYEHTQTNLHKAMKDIQLLSFKEKVSIVRKLVEGVNHLHSYDFVHSELTPQVIYYNKGLCSRDSKVKIGGLESCSLHWLKDSKSYKPKIRKLVPFLDSKEQVDSREVDIYLLGLVIFRIFTGLEIVKKEEADSQIPLSRFSGIKEHEKYLVQNLLKYIFNGSLRIGASAILKHPIFYEENDIIDFVSDLNLVFNRLDIASKDMDVDDFKNGIEIESILNEITKGYRPYTATSLKNQIAFFRNMIEHINKKKAILHAFDQDIFKFVRSLVQSWPKFLSNCYDLAFTKKEHIFIKCF